jgi:hypothetical protein
VDDWDALHARIAEQGFSVPLKSVSQGGLRFLCVDVRPWLGRFVEFTWKPDPVWTAIGER